MPIALMLLAGCVDGVWFLEDAVTVESLVLDEQTPSATFQFELSTSERASPGAGHLLSVFGADGTVQVLSTCPDCNPVIDLVVRANGANAGDFVLTRNLDTPHLVEAELFDVLFDCRRRAPCTVPVEATWSISGGGSAQVDFTAFALLEQEAWSFEPPSDATVTLEPLE